MDTEAIHPVGLEINHYKLLTNIVVVNLRSSFKTQLDWTNGVGSSLQRIHLGPAQSTRESPHFFCA